MGSVRRTELWLSDLQNGRRVTLAPWTTLLAIVISGLVAPHLCAAQSVSASEREALVRLRVDRGGRAEDVDTLIRQAEDAAAKGLPAGVLTNKIREGLAKGADPKRIESVLRQMTTNLETADRLAREMDLTSGGVGRDAALTLMAESLGAGVTIDEVRELSQQAKSSKSPLPLESLANAAKGLSLIKEARLSEAEGSAVIVEAIRQGFRPHEVLDLGRDIKRRENDFRAGRASLRTLRDAIARGDRPDQLFRTSRPEAIDRPTSARPERPAADRPERSAPPERPQRPEQPDRPERAPAGR